MIGKIITGKSFKGAVEYVLTKPGARLLACDGVDTESLRAVIDSFNFQRKARPEIAKVVGHISIAFHPDDAPRLTNEFMSELACEYMHRMGITDTQYIIARHTDTDHPHIHIIYNRVRYDTKLVPDNNERRRNATICKALKQRYGLTFSHGKENINTEKLHGPDQVKHAIYEAIREESLFCRSIEALARQLLQYDIATTPIHRGNDTTKEIQGLTFTKDGLTFKASQIDRQFSYGNLCKTFDVNIERLDVYGVPLTDEQVQQIRDGQYVYLENMQVDDQQFSSYFAADDQIHAGVFYDYPPDRMVQYGHYKMRQMDKDLIERGVVVRAVVEWWSGYGQTARPYLWKEQPTGSTYKEAWDDPRKPKPSCKEELHVPSITPKQKQGGPKL